MPLHNLCVFCASADGTRESYRATAAQLGRTLAAENIGVIYGGATVGLMGAVAQASLEAGGSVVGVIPELLVGKEVAHAHCTELHVVDTMHTRKALMAEKADAFLILPGGYGTLEEMFEVLTWQALSIHQKPICLLNVDGFYDSLLAFLDHCQAEGVLREKARQALLVAQSVEEALQRLRESVSL